jgi:predicted peptidase
MQLTRRQFFLTAPLPAVLRPAAAQTFAVPPLAPDAPQSPERTAVIETFRRKVAGLDEVFEERTYKSAWNMPYRLFRPSHTGRTPPILYLHGSGGLGNDNQKQLGSGNVFGTHLWALPDNQQRFPCYIVAPQTDRGWAKYKPFVAGAAKVVPGFGDGARHALAIVQSLAREFPIDRQRLYVMGQSMGGAGAWNMITHRPKVFAGAIICCGARTRDDVRQAASVPMWLFHGAADRTVPVEASRDRIRDLRNAGGQPLYTEYPV